MNVPVLLVAFAIFAWSADKLRLLHPAEHPLRALGWLIVATFAARLMGCAWTGLHAFTWSMGLHFDLAIWALVGLGFSRQRKPQVPRTPPVPAPFDSEKR